MQRDQQIDILAEGLVIHISYNELLRRLTRALSRDVEVGRALEKALEMDSGEGGGGKKTKKDKPPKPPRVRISGHGIDPRRCTLPVVIEGKGAEANVTWPIDLECSFNDQRAAFHDTVDLKIRILEDWE